MATRFFYIPGSKANTFHTHRDCYALTKVGRYGPIVGRETEPTNHRLCKLCERRDV